MEFVTLSIGNDAAVEDDESFTLTLSSDEPDAIVNASLSATKQTVVGLALQVAFACAGCTHAKYHRALELALGLHTVTPDQYHKTLEIMAPHVSALLDKFDDL